MLPRNNTADSNWWGNTPSVFLICFLSFSTHFWTNFYINELLRAKLWPLTHIISNTQFWQLAVFVRRKALLSVMSHQSSHIRMLALLSGHVTSHGTHFLIPNKLTPLLLPKSSPSSITQPGGNFCVNPGPEEASQEIYTLVGLWLLYGSAGTPHWTQGQSHLHQVSPRHSWFFWLYVQLATHANHYYICLFVCLCFGHGSPLHFLSAISEAKLEQNCSNAVGKSVAAFLHTSDIIKSSHFLLFISSPLML